MAQTIALANLPYNKTVTLTSAYDNNGNRKTLAATIYGTADFTNTYGYDYLGRMTSVSQAGQTGGNTVVSKSAEFQYDLDSRLTNVGYYQSADNSVPVMNSVQTFDHNSNLLTSTYFTGATTSGSALDAFAWTYDADSRVTAAFTMNDMASPNYNGGVDSYWGKAAFTYDYDSELTATSYTNYAHAPTTSVSETYDQNGNRTSASLYPVRWR